MEQGSPNKEGQPAASAATHSPPLTQAQRVTRKYGACLKFTTPDPNGKPATIHDSEVILTLRDNLIGEFNQDGKPPRITNDEMILVVKPNKSLPALLCFNREAFATEEDFRKAIEYLTSPPTKEGEQRVKGTIFTSISPTDPTARLFVVRTSSRVTFADISQKIEVNTGIKFPNDHIHPHPTKTSLAWFYCTSRKERDEILEKLGAPNGRASIAVKGAVHSVEPAKVQPRRNENTQPRTEPQRPRAPLQQTIPSMRERQAWPRLQQQATSQATTNTSSTTTQQIQDLIAEANTNNQNTITTQIQTQLKESTAAITAAVKTTLEQQLKEITNAHISLRATINQTNDDLRKTKEHLTNIERALKANTHSQQQQTTQAVDKLGKELQTEINEIGKEMANQRITLDALMDRIVQVEQAQSRMGATASDLAIADDIFTAEEQAAREEAARKKPKGDNERNEPRND